MTTTSLNDLRRHVLFQLLEEKVPEHEAVTIEEKIFNLVQIKHDESSLISLYKLLGYEKMAHLKINKDKCLQDIDQGKIGWDSFVYQKYQDYSDNKFTESNNNIVMRDGDFMCRKCKSKKCTYYTLQTRGGDEGMTTFISCNDCCFRWREA